MEAIMDYYILKNKTNPWGDYGDILFTGFLNTFTYEKVKVKKTMRGKKINGKYTYEERMVEESSMVDLEYPELERTGPYIPEIYKANSSYIVMIDRVKEMLENSEITGIRNLKKAIKKKIADINWTEWDDFESRLNDLSEELKTGEPEDLISKVEHNEETEKMMPDVWCAEIQKDAYTMEIISNKGGGERYILSETPAKDVSMPRNMLYIIASENFKNTIEKNNIGTIQFEKVEISK
jgi:hypothetical protein